MKVSVADLVMAYERAVSSGEDTVTVNSWTVSTAQLYEWFSRPDANIVGVDGRYVPTPPPPGSKESQS